MQAKLQSNIWKYTIYAVTHKRIFVAILAAYYLIVPGVTEQEIGVIMLLGSLVALFFEIPSGYFADKFGHKLTLILAQSLMLLSTLIFLFTFNYAALLLAASIWMLGLSFGSGTGNAFMHETLRGLGRDHEYTQVMGKVSALGFAIPIVLTVLVPFLVEIDFKAPFVVAAVSDFVGLLAVIAMVKPKVPQEHVNLIADSKFMDVVKEGVRLGFLKYAAFAAILMGLIISTTAYRASYQAELDIPIIWFGVLFGIGRAFASILLVYSGEIKKKLTHHRFMQIELILFAILLVAFGLTSDPILVASIFIISNAFLWGFLEIRKGFLLSIIKDSKFKATHLSIEGMILHIFAGAGSLWIGYMVVRSSYQASFFVFSLAFIAILTGLYIYIVRTKKAQLKAQNDNLRER